jgi:pimeloyl-ACP methyl ester carboxylesterase
MLFMPFNIVGIWFRGLLAVAIIAGGVCLLKRGYDESYIVEPALVRPKVVETLEPDGASAPRNATAVVPVRRVFRFEPGLNRQTGYFASGIALLTLALVGRWGRQWASTIAGGPKRGQSTGADAPREDRSGEIHRITRPDGSELQVECRGPIGAQPIVLTHGWGCNSTAWFYIKENLSDRFRVIVWDEPGLGRSKKPDNNDYRLEKLAADLDAVLAFAGERPAILVGHSIGGMITLTFCKDFPGSLGGRVAGLVLAHTSYTNPVRTTKMAAVYTAIEKPVLIPLLYLTIAVWPLVWVMNWLSYLNGSAHRSTAKESFAGTETQGQLDFCARFMPRGRPDVLARGMLGMIGYDATATLSTISVPVLVVVGDQDSTTLPEAGQYISRNVPDARLATLSPAKHVGVIEHHARFSELVAGFASACDTTGVGSKRDGGLVKRPAGAAS